MADKTTEEQPSDTDRQAIRTASDAAAELLLVTGLQPPVIQNAIDTFVDQFLEGAANNPLGEDLSFALAALWANSICEAYGWEWIVPVHGDWRGLGIADPDRKYLALPFNFFSELIDNRNKEMPGPLVRFEAIGANHLPESSPGRYVIISS